MILCVAYFIWEGISQTGQEVRVKCYQQNSTSREVCWQAGIKKSVFQMCYQETSRENSSVTNKTPNLERCVVKQELASKFTNANIKSNVQNREWVFWEWRPQKILYYILYSIVKIEDSNQLKREHSSQLKIECNFRQWLVLNVGKAKNEIKSTI